ncbi:MAG TPA: serine/threonine-protein kinase [Polyangiaceae bacterium]|jgi:serine/threonine-protein kinase|nr:serine/threonine-protein kinase [Polyangiaceae bacterium]
MPVSEAPVMKSSGGAPGTELGSVEELVDGRYRIVATLGRGGTAIVHDVLDTATGERRALKRLLPQDSTDKRVDAVTFFEREFFTLSELVHPRIVRVYDYGVDGTAQYYTMELLDGGDLQKKAPVPWRDACAYGRDVCSALALVHSRRMVYRDLSPRNVRCTSDGLAKLIDFGAMGPMGPARELIGTLPCCAPETVDLQPLDGRTDLYALGATLYYTLTGRHAYPARDFHQLVEMWRTRPRRPSELARDVPAALDGLILDLMSAEPSARPASAAEVMERLAAIAGLASDEQLLVSQSYLSTPTLVGREEQLGHIRKLVARTERHGGASVLVRGPAGVGRSRLLDALVLEGKVAGATVLRADASDGAAPYGVVRAVASQLLRLLPDVALAAAEPHVSILGHVAPGLLDKHPDVVLATFEDPQHMGRRVQPAFRQWLTDVGRHRLLVIAIDDVHRVDEASVATFAILSNEVSERSILLASTLDSRVAPPAHLVPTLKLFADASSVFELDVLTAPHAEQLLGSIFGEQPKLSLLAHRLFAIAGGNPRDLLRLSQHLVDRKVLRYQTGAWLLPEEIEQVELPTSMAQALRERVAALDAGARELAVVLAFAPGERFTFDECLLATEHRSRARLAKSLDELLAREVLVESGTAYHLGRQGFNAALREDVTEEQQRDVHRRLARVFVSRGDGFREARHLFFAEEYEHGLDTFVTFCRESEALTNTSSDAFVKLIQSMPLDWFDGFETALRLAAEQKRSPRDVYAIRSRLAGLIAMVGSKATPHIDALVVELRRESGLALYESLDPALESGERLGKAMGATWQRYQELPDSEKVVDPATALTGLARALIQMIGVLAITCDYDGWKKLPSLRAFAPVSPALAVIDQLVQGFGARISGRIEDCLAVYRPLLERLSHPDRAGLDESHHRHMRLRVVLGVCTLEATMGVPPDAATMRELEADAFYEASAALVRMVEHVWQGDVTEAERCKKQIELLQIQAASRAINDGTHLLSELIAYAFMNDLTRVRRTIDAVEAMANEHPPWLPVLHYGRGEYQRIRGDNEGALAELDRALEAMAPGEARAWPHAAGARLFTLLELGRAPEAKKAAEEYAADASRADIGYAKGYVEMPYSLVLAKLGEFDAAVEMSDRIIATFRALGIAGLNLATAHEVRAKIALAMDERVTFEEHAALSSRERGGRHGLTSARYAEITQSGLGADVLQALNDQGSVLSQFTSVLARCKSSGDRASRGLEMLVRLSGALGGALYMVQAKTVACVAHTGRLEPNATLDALAQGYLENEVHDENETLIVDEATAVTAFTREWRGPGADRYVPVLLGHHASSGLAVSGVAVLVVDATCRFTYPAALATELSRICHEAGDNSVELV